MKKSLLGALLIMESQFMALALLCSLYYRITLGDDDWRALAPSAVLTFLVGLWLLLRGRWGTPAGRTLSKGDCFVVVGLTWAVFSLFGMLPLLLWGWPRIGVATAWFETMSGFTTTGATALDRIETLPHGLLLWRSLTQWMGGLGIVVFSFALLPASGVKNANIYQAEATGISLDRLKPKISATARRLLAIYLLLTALCAVMYRLGPMGTFDAVNHALTTLATGGYSTHSASLAHFRSAYVEYVAVAFMLLASVNFSLYYYLSARRLRLLWHNEELRAFVGIFVCASALFALLFAARSLGLIWGGTALSPTGAGDTLRASLFHVATIMSTTGFQGQYADYVGWGSAFWVPTVCLMAIGACAGSTAGGVKVVRTVIAAKALRGEFLLHLHPHAVVSVRVSQRSLPAETVRRVLVFILLYAALAGLGAFVLTLLGTDIDTSIGACVSALSNIGPGTGVWGPASTFASAPAACKWLLSFYMLVGRLEIFTVLFLFMPRAWRH